MVEPGEPDSLDMARTLANYSFIVGEQIFEGLFRWTPTGLVPWLAQDVRVSPDGKSWTLKLRQGVTSTTARRSTRRRSKFNLERIRDGKAFAYAGLLAPLADIKAPTTHRADHHEGAVRAVPLRSSASSTSESEPDGAPEARRDSGSNPVGTGPFKFQSWQRGGELTLVRNDAYWGDKALLDRIVITAIPDLNGRVSALEAGDADVIVEVPPSEVARLSKSNRVQVLSAVTSRNQWLRFNELKPPFEKPQVAPRRRPATQPRRLHQGRDAGPRDARPEHRGPGGGGYTELGVRSPTIPPRPRSSWPRRACRTASAPR